ncbi:hypothetical protein MOF34_15910 [Bacillus sp. T17B1]|uniref:hypothetical protein n=1 Tax=Bacillus sp. T17B1 TaxID=2918911 RepID=UPI002282F4BC|nr:hypothetical protein [Bacillus sp. T17B1]
MTETNAKIHVLADETLDGIMREYVEVDRKAEVGEKIVIVARKAYDDRYENGDVFTVSKVWEGKEGEVGGRRYSFSQYNEIGLIYHNEYRVIEPTNIVHIANLRYELTDRKAEVGEKVIVVRPDEVIGGAHDAGRVETVKSRHSDGDVSVETIGMVFSDEYRVLVQLDKQKKAFENENSVYKEMKNFIHNDLGISRQDIQEMISVAVSNEVQKMYESGKLDSIAGAKIESLIEEGFRDGGRMPHGFKERVSQTVSEEVGKRIAKILNINVELKKGRN